MSCENENEILTSQKEISIITFKVGDKLYGIDIMNVKEICDAADFTFIPNTAKYVRGVYNLRGEIISVIDLRILFNVKYEKRSKEDLIVLAFGDYYLAVIVDEIQKVYSFNEDDIQPVHNVFTDINIKYIQGITNITNQFIIILDVLKLFASNSSKNNLSSSVNFHEDDNEEVVQVSNNDINSFEDYFLSFINNFSEFTNYFVNKTNENFFRKYLKNYFSRNEKYCKIESVTEADKVLKSFKTKNNSIFWIEDYMNKLKNSFSFDSKKQLKCWMPKCQSYTQAFSLAVFFSEFFQKSKFKIWAMDDDFSNISSCQDAKIKADDVDSLIQNYGTIDDGIFKFNKNIKDSIIFEYHDIENLNNLPFMDIIVARDILSLYPKTKVSKILNELVTKVEVGGYIVIGDNEELVLPNFKLVDSSCAKIYKKI